MTLPCFVVRDSANPSFPESRGGLSTRKRCFQAARILSYSILTPLLRLCCCDPESHLKKMHLWLHRLSPLSLQCSSYRHINTAPLPRLLQVSRNHSLRLLGCPRWCLCEWPVHARGLSLACYCLNEHGTTCAGTAEPGVGIPATAGRCQHNVYICFCQSKIGCYLLPFYSQSKSRIAQTRTSVSSIFRIIQLNH